MPHPLRALMIPLAKLSLVLTAALAIWVSSLLSPNNTAHAGTVGTPWCGNLNQAPCNPDQCTIKPVWLGVLVYPEEECLDPCAPGLEVTRQAGPDAKAVCAPPSGGCDISCKITKIKEKLGTPCCVQPDRSMYCWTPNEFGVPPDPYGGRKVSRADIGLPDADRTVHVDIGGEGLHQQNGLQWGSNEAINLNCSLKTTEANPRVRQPIKNLIFGFGQNMPFTEKFADVISLYSAPIHPKEIERVIRPGGQIVLGTLQHESDKLRELESDLCQFPRPASDGYHQLNVVILVPTDFDYTRPKKCPVPRDELP